jgi:hypothetical protein
MWKQIKDSVYDVSDNGIIRNRISGKIMKSHLTDKGYVRIGLRIEKNKEKKYRVNRIVAEAFLSNYNDNMEVHHINNIRTDNRVSNLECISSEENKLRRNYLTIKEIIEKTIFMVKENSELNYDDIIKKLLK